MTNAVFAPDQSTGGAVFASNAPSAADTTAPIFTGTLAQTAVSSTTCTIDWSGTTHTDDVGITGYEYSINAGIYYAIGNVLSYQFTGFAPSTTYTIAIRAFDAAGNRSTPLSIATTTSAASSTVTSVSVSPSTATGSAQFTATVAGTNSPSQSVVWSTTAGTITSLGYFSAPVATASVQAITVTATSAQNGTKAGTATVTIAATGPTPITPGYLVPQEYFSAPIEITGSGATVLRATVGRVIATEYGIAIAMDMQYDLSGYTGLSLTITRPDLTTATIAPPGLTIGTTPLSTPLGVFATNRYVTYNTTSTDLTQEGVYSFRVTYADATKRLLSPIMRFSVSP